jgi:type VI secretion system protein ImpK
MSDRVYGVCSDVLMLAVRFPFAPSLPPAPELRQRLQTALDLLIGKGRAAGISDPDLAEIRYALVAFIDEQILKSNWPGRTEWMRQPLQLLFYQTTAAGEVFFTRMRSLLNDGNRLDPLSLYALLLLLGFRGQYGASGDAAGPASFLDAARHQLSRTLPRIDRLAPHAEPGERAQKRKVSNAPLIAFIVGGLLVAFGSVVGLERVLASDVEGALEKLPATAKPAVPQPGSSAP